MLADDADRLSRCASHGKDIVEGAHLCEVCMCYKKASRRNICSTQSQRPTRRIAEGISVRAYIILTRFSILNPIKSSDER